MASDYPTVVPDTVAVSSDEEREEKKVVDRIMERYTVSEQFDRPFKEAALRHWKAVNNVLPDDWPYTSKIWEPETQINSNDAVEQIMTQVFSKEQVFDLHPVEDQDVIQTEFMRELMNFVLRQHVRYKLVKFFQCQEAAYFGNGVEKHLVKTEIKQRREQKPIIFDNGLGGIAIGMQEVVTPVLEAWPISKVVSRFDCYPAATGSTIQEMPYFIERVLLPLDVVKARARQAGYIQRNVDRLDGFFTLDNDAGTMSHWAEEHFDLPERLAAIGYDVKNYGSTAAGEHSVKYVELFVYSEAPMDGNEGCAKICIIGNRRLLLKSGRNPFTHGKKSYSEIKYAPRSAQVWQAKGIPELMEGLQEKINHRSNQIGDIISFHRAPMTLVGATAGIEDLSDLDPWPGAAVRCGDPNAIVERRRPDVPQSLYIDIDYTRASIQRASGATDYGRGLAGKSTGLTRGTETATGLSLLLNRQQQGMTFKWLLAEETGITDGLNITASNIAQVMTAPQKIRILGENRVLADAGFSKFLMIRPEDIAGGWDFYAVGASRSQEDSEQAERIKLWLQAGLSLPEVAQRLRQVEVWTEIGELTRVRQPARFIKSPEEMVGQQQNPATELLKSISAAFKDLPPDAKAALLQLVGLPSEGAQQQAALSSAANVASAVAARQLAAGGVQPSLPEGAQG